MVKTCLAPDARLLPIDERIQQCPQRQLQGKEKVSVFYDRQLQTVWVEDLDEGITLLWQRGFFGKGNLSRSEPTWRQRKVNEIDALRKGRMTAEQLTQQRRKRERRSRSNVPGRRCEPGSNCQMVSWRWEAR